MKNFTWRKYACGSWNLRRDVLVYLETVKMATSFNPQDSLCMFPESVVPSKVEGKVASIHRSRWQFPEWTGWALLGLSSCYKPLQLYYLWGGCSDLHQIKVFSSVLVKVKYFCWGVLGMHTSIWIHKCAVIKSHGAYGIFKEPGRREENILKEKLTHPPSLRQSVYIQLMEKGSAMSLLMLMLIWWGKTLIFIFTLVNM